MQEVISIRVPRELKEKMKKYDVNWKEYLIEAIEEKLKELESREVLDALEKMNKNLMPTDIPSWKLIREDRER